MSAIDELLENNAAYAHAFDRADLPSAPAKKVAVCSTRRNSGYVIGQECQKQPST